MPRMVNVHDAKTNFSKLIDEVHAGGEVIVAKAGKPFIRMVPLEAARQPRQPGGITGRLPDSFFDPLPEGELRLWNGEGE